MPPPAVVSPTGFSNRPKEQAHISGQGVRLFSVSVRQAVGNSNRLRDGELREISSTV